MERSVYWLLLSTLALLLVAQEKTDITHIASHAYAVYDGIDIYCLLLWSWLVEKLILDKWNIGTAVIYLISTTIILLVSRG
ncbi:MAG: hypothetical protein J6568_01605 [Snodgrassella sp.]|jgi:small multidrug resistance family-3 protein|nr:hypothetical protein [Snodgrassella sp.]